MENILSIAVCVTAFISGFKAQSDFQCPELMGRYQDPFDCQRFYVCSYGNAYQFSCDNGTRYDHDIGVCRHASDVICRTGNQLMTEVFTCPTMNGMFRDGTSCNHFYLCANGRHFRLACPPGLQFNGAVCTWKSANGCKLGSDYENEVNWKSDLKIPSNDVDKEELPRYKSSFENSNNDVEFENEYYDSTPEEGGSDFPRFVEKVKTMDDIDTIQIGLLAPKGKKMSAETSDRTTRRKVKTTTTATTRATTTTRKPTTTAKSTTTKSRTTVTTRRTTPKKTTTASTTTPKKTTPRKITKKVAKILKTTPTVTTTQKAKATTAKVRATTAGSNKNMTLNVTLDNVNTTQTSTTVASKKTSRSKMIKTTARVSSTTGQTMKAVKYNGAKALISDTSVKPKSSTTSKPTTNNTSSTAKATDTKPTQKVISIVSPTVASNSTGNDTLDSDTNTTLSLQNITLDANVTSNSNDTDNSTSLISDDDTGNSTNSTVSTTTTSSSATKVSSTTTANTTVSKKDKVQKTKPTTKVTKPKVVKSTTAKTTPNKRKVSRSVDSVKRRGDAKFRLDSAQLKQ